ncbi:MAG: biotin/lipoyl-binding protein, partial [Lachnospiraceae bacterium]|nr:biotin/lipoyl-binding protein [Lachnospiraceae bacterium]
MTKKKRVRLIIIIAAVVVAVAAALVLVRILNKNKKVEVYPVSMINDPYWGNDAQYTGNVSAGRVMNVKLRNALVESVPVHEGQHVSQGDVLLVYDAAEYQLTLLADEANIAVQEARIERAKKMARHYQSLRPSEDAPQPKKETIDHGPLPIKKELKAEDVKEDDMDFMITPKTVIKKEFLKRLREKGWMCRLILYQDDTNFGTYIIDGLDIPEWVYVYVADDETDPEEPTGPDEGGEVDPDDPEE